MPLWCLVFVAWLGCAFAQTPKFAVPRINISFSATIGANFYDIHR